MGTRLAGALADVAGEKGVELQTIADAYIAQRTEVLNQAVSEGRITQQQADAMLAQMQETVLEHLQEGLPARGGGPGGCWGQESEEGTWQGGPRMGPGRFQNAPGQTSS